MDNLKYLSYSRISTYSDCSLKYYFGYIKKLPRGSGTALEFGSAIHEALDKFHSEIKGKVNPGKNFLINAFEASWEDKVMFSPAEITEAEVKTNIALGITLLNNYYNMNNGTEWFHQPIATEIAYKVPVIDPYTKKQLTVGNINTDTGEVVETPMEFYVIIDLMQIYNGDLLIIDHKTSSRKYSDHKINTDIQLTIYQYAIEYLLHNNLIKIDKEYKDIKVCFNVFHKVKAAYVKPYITTRNEEDVRRALIIAKHALQGISDEVFVPNFGSMWCGNCDYKDACQTWGKFTDE